MLPFVFYPRNLGASAICNVLTFDDIETTRDPSQENMNNSENVDNIPGNHLTIYQSDVSFSRRSAVKSL